MARARSKAPAVEGEAETNTVAMHASGDQSAVTIGEQTFEVDEEGNVEVPLELVNEFKAHGFERK